MKRILIFSAALMMGLSINFFAGTAQAQNPVKKQTVEKKTAKVYTCPMHPEVISDKPGKCPKCGMTLVEKKAGMKQGGMHHMHDSASMKKNGMMMNHGHTMKDSMHMKKGMRKDSTTMHQGMKMK